MDSVNVRNLEQIQELDQRARSSRIGALFLASLAGAALVTAAYVMGGRSGPPAASNRDPLAELVEAARKTGVPAESLDGKDVTFPRILSDGASPTTALAAVKDERGRLLKQDAPDPGLGTAAASELVPPPATDRLPVVPLPVGALLNATAVTMEPRDELTGLAAKAAAQRTDGEMAPPGMEGGFQLQIASFKEQADADKLVEDLRRRGHKAFRQAAHVPDRGLWHRVRIGPFKTKFEATRYKERFERTERVAPFVVDPERVKQAEEQRAARLASLQKKRERSTGE